MTLNIGFLVCTLIVGLFVDWVFQTQWQAQNKSKWGEDASWDSFCALYTHSWVYAWVTMWTVGMMGFLPMASATMVLLVLFTSHFLIDTRIPVKWILRRKGMTEEQLNDPHFWMMHIGIDHRLHEIVILVLAFIV